MKKFAYIDDFEQWKKDFKFYIEVEPRFAETDQMGHVNNRFAFVYFESARIEFFTEVGLLNHRDKNREHGLVVADLQCDFLRQIYFRDQLRIYVKVDHVGNSSIDVHYLALNQNEEPCLVGRGRVVKINLASGRPAPVTDEEKNNILNYNK